VEGKPKGLQGFARAATGIVNLGVAGAAAVGAAALQSWPLLAVGGVTYAALVAWDLVRGPGKTAARAADLRALREPSQYADVQTQQTVRALLGAKVEIDRVLSETPDEVKGNLAMALVSVDALLERAAGLGDRAEDLSRYLLTKDPRVVRQDVESLRQRVSQTADAEARAQYQSALASREDHLKALDDLRNARERVLASMLSIASSLEGLPAKIVHMRALDADAMDKLGGDVKGELERVNDEMKAFEETLRTMGERDE
jgi:hypothetical protein